MIELIRKTRKIDKAGRIGRFGRENKLELLEKKTVKAGTMDIEEGGNGKHKDRERN